MAKGIDCATPLTAEVAEKFRADGYEFACRYLVPSGWKRLTRTEADAISGAGLQIVSVWETTEDRALGGYAAGLADGTKALEVAAVVGQTPGSRIYFAVDFDANSRQMQTVVDYIAGCSKATPGYLTGVYGSATVVQAVMDAGACSGYWQTYAWSRGVKVPGIQIHQYDNGPSGLGKLVNGINVDLNESYGNEGWWNTLPPVEEEVKEYMMSAEDANKVIRHLSAGWFVVQGNAAAEAEFKRLANELRKASGQPEE